MAPIHSVASIATTTIRLSIRAQSSVGTMVAKMMTSPPIVGVPRFPWWLAGPSARMIWPILWAWSRRMTAGPTMKDSTSAVTPAPAARKAM